MDIKTLGMIAIIILLMSIVPFTFHVRSYTKLLASIKRRGIDTSNLEPELFDYGSRGFIRKIKIIETKHLLNGGLSKEEEQMLNSSKHAYYAMAPFLLGFIILLGVVLLEAA